MSKRSTKARAELEMSLMMHKRKPYVIVEGELIPQEQTEFVNIEEDFNGRDVVTFNYHGVQYKSWVVVK